MRFLVIDDEKFVADSLAMILEGDGHEAMAVYDGQSALERVNFFTPDCVISDVIMPGMNGIEVCSLIEEKHPKCQIVLFSGQPLLASSSKRPEAKVICGSFCRNRLTQRNCWQKLRPFAPSRCSLQRFVYSCEAARMRDPEKPQCLRL